MLPVANQVILSVSLISGEVVDSLATDVVPIMEVVVDLNEEAVD